jgi:ECF transporter S component (folate family)
MKNFFILFKNRIMFYICSILILTLIPYFVSVQVSRNVNRYSLCFKYDNSISINDLISKDNLYFVKDEINRIRMETFEKGNKYPYSDFSYVNIESLSKNIEIKEENDYYKISVLQKSFNSKEQARRFLKGVVENKKIINDSNVSYVSKDIIINEYVISNNYLLPSFIISFVVISISFVLLYFIHKDFYNINVEYDNINMYRTPFHLSYWKSQFKWLHSIRDMVMLSILFALMKVVGFISLPSGFSNLGIGITYLIFSLIGMIYGPANAFIIGALSDIIGFAMGQSGTIFHIGYTLNAALAGLSYGLALYKTNINFSKMFISRLFVNLFVNVFLGSIWWAQVQSLSFEKMQIYMLFTSLPKNLVYLLPQSILMFIFIKAISRPLFDLNIITLNQENSIKII